METATLPEINTTALERKWAEEAANTPPALEDAYTELGLTQKNWTKRL
jgi:predicted ATPase